MSFTKQTNKGSHPTSHRAFRRYRAEDLRALRGEVNHSLLDESITTDIPHPTASDDSIDREALDHIDNDRSFGGSFTAAFEQAKTIPNVRKR